MLRRTADDNDPYERVIVANADQLLIVAALADPPPVYGLIDRCVVAALTAGLEPILLLTKADLASPDEVLANYAPLDVPAIVTRRGADLAAVRRGAGRARDGVRRALRGGQVHPGQRPGAGRGPQHRRGQRGRQGPAHLHLGVRAGAAGAGARLGDRHPGVRSFGLAHVSADDVLWAFPDLEDGAAQCPGSCEHLSADDGCRLDAWVADGHSTPARLDAFRRLLVSRKDLGGAIVLP